MSRNHKPYKKTTTTQCPKKKGKRKIKVLKDDSIVVRVSKKRMNTGGTIIRVVSEVKTIPQKSTIVKKKCEEILKVDRRI